MSDILDEFFGESEGEVKTEQTDSVDLDEFFGEAEKIKEPTPIQAEAPKETLPTEDIKATRVDVKEAKLTDKVIPASDTPEYSLRRAGGQFWKGGQDVIKNAGVGVGIILVQKDKDLTGEQLKSTADAEEKIYNINEARLQNVPVSTIWDQAAVEENERARQDKVAKLMRASGERLMKATNADWLKTNPEYLKSAGFWEDLIQAVPQVVAQVAISVGTGGLGGGAFMGAQIFGSTYTSQIENGVPHEQAMAAAMANTMMQAPMEAFGIGKVTKLWKTKGAIVGKLKKWFAASGTEGFTEFLQQIPEHATNLWSENPDVGLLTELWNTVSNADEMRKWVPEGAKAGAIGGILGFGAAVAGSAVNRKKETAEVEKELADADSQRNQRDELNLYRPLASMKKKEYELRKQRSKRNLRRLKRLLKRKR